MVDYATMRQMLETGKKSPEQFFWEDISSRCKWDLLPWGFIYDLYQVWLPRYIPEAIVWGKTTMAREIKRCVAELGGWRPVHSYRSAVIEGEEPLIEEFGLESKWSDPYRVTMYAGLVRINK